MFDFKVKLALLALVVSTISLANADEPVVLVSGSRFLRSNKKFDFNVASNKLNNALSANFTLSGLDQANNNVLLTIENKSIPPSALRWYSFDTSALTPGSYNLQISLYDRVTKNFFQQSQSLVYNSKKFSCFLHTDKGMYKGGDTVNFDVFCIDSETRPFNPVNGSVNIYDSGDLKIKSFANLEFSKGKAKGSFVLNDKAAKGVWKLKFDSENEFVEKQFEVQDYVLKAYSLEFDVPSRVPIPDGTFEATVIATYTFGEAVEGVATVTFWKYVQEWVEDNGGWNGDWGGPWWGWWPRGHYVNKRVDLFVKTVEVDSSAESFEVDIDGDLDIYYAQEIYVDVRFVESSTGKVLTTSAIISFIPFAFELLISGDDTFVQNVPYEFTASVRRIGSGVPAPAGTDVRVNIYSYTPCFYQNGYWNCPSGSSSYLNGVTDASGSVSFQHNPQSYESMSINAYSSKTNSAYKSVTRPKYSGIKAEILTSNIQVGSPIEIAVESLTPSMTKCFVQVLAKGLIVAKREINFVNQEAIVSFTPSSAYAPKSEVIFYSIDASGNVITMQLTLNFENLENYVNLELSQSVVKPGKSTNLKVSSKKFSTVTVYGLDVSSKLLRAGNEFSKSDVINDQKSEYDQTNWNYWNAPADTQVFEKLNFFAKKIKVFIPQTTTSTTTESTTQQTTEMEMTQGTEAEMTAAPMPEETMMPEPMPTEELLPPAQMTTTGPDQGPDAPVPPAPAPPPVTRKNFVEVIEISDIEVVKGKKIGSKFDPINAEATVSITVPESITSFDFSAVSMNNIHGLGLSDKVTKLKIFQEFFAQLTLPHHVKRGETAIANIGVFNYLGKEQNVTLYVVKNDAEFSVVRAAEDGWKVNNNQYYQTFLSMPNKLKNFRMAIKPNVLGSVKVKVDAIGRFASDSLEKPLKVIPEGVPKTITQSVLILKNDPSSIFTASLQCILPPTAVSDTTEAYASIAGDLMGPMINGMDNLIQMSYGCGEQNLLTFVPSVVALRYLETTGKLTASLRSKAIGFAEAGYQNQLNYRRSDGSFSAFGNSDQSGSTWLTAFSVDAFVKASRYITVDSAVISSAFSYFVNKQNPNGSFREDGNVIHKEMQGGSSSGTPLTAFVAIVLARNIQKYPNYASALNKALNFISLNTDDSDIYALAISTYALHLGGHSSFASFYAKFLAAGTETADQLSWGKPVPVSSEPRPWWDWYQPKSLDIEMTSYGLQIMADVNMALAAKVTKNLVSRKNAYGGYGSTQDTVQALSALSEFSIKFNAAAGSIDLKLTPDVGNVINAQVNANNLLVVQEFKLNNYARSLDIFSGAGSSGSAIVTLTCEFYEDAEETSPRFNANVNLIRPCRENLKIEVCVSYIPKYDDVQSNMALVNLKFPSGYMYDYDTDLTEDIRLLETADDGAEVNIYFNSFDAQETCFVIEALQLGFAEDFVHSAVEVTDYYAPEKKTQIFYNLPSDLVACKDLPQETTTRKPSTNDPWEASTIFWEQPRPQPMPEPPMEMEAAASDSPVA